MKLGLLFSPLAYAKSLYDGPMGGVGKCFIKSIYECIPIQESPICDETHADFNPITCALKLNVCLINSMGGIVDCVENGDASETSVAPYEYPLDGAPLCFMASVYQCIPIQESPVCDEDSPEWNPMPCVIKLNVCLINSMSHIPECMENLPDLPEPEPSVALYDGPMGGVGKCFLTSIYECIPIQESPICDETHADFNPVTCAVKLNVCLINSMGGITECIEEGKKSESDLNPYYGPMNGMGVCFLQAVYKCLPVQDSWICDEENPDFGVGIPCAIKLNICLINTMSDIPECVENLPEQIIPH